jgi:hypothetical protein
MRIPAAGGEGQEVVISAVAYNFSKLWHLFQVIKIRRGPVTDWSPAPDV